MKPSWWVLTLVLATAACERSQPEATRLQLGVSALSLEGIGDAIWDVEVLNGQDPRQVVWQRRVTSSRYGDGQGSVTYVGPCDADAPANLVRVWVVGLYDAPVAAADAGTFAAGANTGLGAVTGTPVAFTNPTLLTPLEQTFTCIENADVPVTFDVTLMRPATQGFFDVAVSFNDIFCSAKFDCCYDRDDNGCAADGSEDISLLFDETSQRNRTYVLAFACTAGADLSVDTELYLDALELDCDVGSGPQVFAADLTLDPTAGAPGNLCTAGDLASCPAITAGAGVDPDAFLYQVASYVGAEALTSGGLPANKLYWNVALGVRDPITGCRLRTRGTADDAADPNDQIQNGVVAPGAIYPYIAWDVPLGACGSHALSGEADAPVRTTYTTSTSTLSFDYHVGQTLIAGGFCTPACLHGGACIDGACDCTNTGYVGDQCETPLVPPDTTPPLAPSITSPTSPHTSATSSVELIGTCETGAYVQMTGAATGATLCADGAFSLTLTATTDGTHVVSLTQTDAANNTSPATGFTWVRDTVAPSAPTVLEPAEAEVLTASTTLTISGTCTSGMIVELRGDANEDAACDGTFSFTVGATDGTWVYTLRQFKPSNGLASAAVTRTWTRDTEAPAAPNLTQPSSPHTTAADLVTAAGTCEAGATVYLAGDQTESVLCDGTFSFDLIQTANGTYTYAFTQRDPAGNLSVATELTVVRDDTLPAAPAVTSPASSPFASPTSPLTLSGSCTEDFIVHLTGAATDSATCTGGAFSFEVTANTDGTYLYLLHQESHLTGLVSADTSVTWVFDTAAPDAPVLTTPASSPHTTGGDSLQIGGTCEPGATVLLSGDATASTSCDGTFAFDVIRTVNGTYTFSVTQRDPAGNTSTPTALEWTRDATIPPEPVVTSHVSPFTSATSTLALEGTCQTGFTVHLAGAETADATCTSGAFTFSLSQSVDGDHAYQLTQENPLTGLESGVTDFTWTRDTLAPSAVAFTAPSSNPFVSGDSLIALAGTCEAGATVLLSGAATDEAPCTTGTFLFELAQSVDGTYDYHVSQRDLAGNLAPLADFTWTRDTTVPVTPLISAPAGGAALTNTLSLAITGSCEDGFDVELSGDDTQTTACSGGAFTFTVTEAGEGSFSYDLLQRSSLNGFASATTTVTWQIDQTAPAASTFSAPATSPHYSATTSLTLSGPCTAGTTILLGAAQTASTACTGSYSFALSKATDGTYDYTLAARDPAGNTSTATAFRWILDRTVPSAPAVTSPLSSPHTSASSSLVLSGTCTTDFIVYLQGASTQTQTCAAGAFAFTVTADTDGTYSYQLYQESHLTGLESTTASFTWVRDTTAPDEVTVTSPPSNPYFSGDSAITIAGGCETGATVSISGSHAGSMVCANGQYAFNVTKTVNTTYNFNLVQTDAAGNASLTLLFQWVRDNTIPATPVITSPTTPHYGTSANLTITGTCISTYTVFLAGAGSQSQTCNGSAFSFSVSQTNDGTFEYLVYQENPLTFIESSTTSLSWTLDRVAPSAITLTAPTSNPYSSGDTTFPLQGTCETGATVALTGAQTGTVTCAGGTFRFDLTSNTNGTFNYSLRQTDRAGNQSPSLAFQWTRDTSKPATPVISSPTPNPYTSNTSSITLAGSCTGSNTVNVAGAATLSATCAGGAFSFVINKASDGTYVFDVTQTSSVNGSVSSVATLTWTRDTVAPAAPTLTAISPTSPAANPNPKVTGTAGAGTVTLQLYRTANCSGAIAATGTLANFTGAGVAVPALLQQTMSVSAKALDLAGNASACSATSLAYTHRAAERIMDINQTGNGASSPGPFGVVGTKVFFRATNGIVGNELFVSDGTAQGTTMVKDISAADSSNPLNFVAFNGLAFFAAADDDTGYELWKSDGTDSGTVRVADIYPGPFSSTPANFLVVGSTLYFTADDGENGVELWKTDGTTGGTVLVKDVEPGFGGSAPTQLRAIGSTIVFRATTTAEGVELWRSDGTAAGTTVFDINAGTASGNPNYLVNMGSYVYFQGSDAATGSELWRTDGNTVTRLIDLYVGASGSGPSNLAVAGSTIFMYARRSASNVGYELFKYTDAGGAVLVKDINTVTTANSGNSSPALIVPISATKVVFRAYTSTTGNELWVSDGTDAGTFQLADLNPGLLDSAMTTPVAVGGRAYFAATTEGEVELWATDGTIAGTVRYDVNPGSNGSTPSNLTVFGDKVIASIHTIATGREPFLVDAGGPTLMADLNPLPSSSPGSFALYGGALYFAADDGVNGRELWRTDGTTAGTWMVKDINAEAGAHSSPTYLVVAGSYLYFRADDGINGVELWRSDGTANGTVMVTDIAPGAQASTPNYLVAFGSQLLFVADDGTNGIELWTATGTGAATLVKDIYAGATTSSPVLLTVMGAKVYFRATTLSEGAELWATDGTTAGTAIVKNIVSGATSSTPANLTVVGGTKLFFTSSSSATGSELFVSDGTSAGTVLVQDLYPGATGSAPTNLRDLNGVCVFSALTSTYGRELYKSSGVAGDVTLVKDIRTGAGSSNPASPLVLDGKLYFSAADDAAGTELWVSNGTTAGTTRVLDGRAGVASSTPANLTAIDATSLLFTANDGVNGTEPWRSNLTAAGTYMVQDINVYGPSWGGAILTLGTTVIFAANDGLTGTELWKY